MKKENYYIIKLIFLKIYENNLIKQKFKNNNYKKSINH